ncbi:MAG TPA: type II toxin-antitoxin system RelE/ParE family toxin [Caulobacteraceae bacterium]|jgi:hypothetical protein|nr:type II toxin-antitoxin system RelE/ParE family toxin [Caulobacteraceae bacterium]
MAAYLTKAFARFAGKAGLNDGTLLDAARAVAEGRFDADLGGGVFKQRVARPGAGKSGGFRTIILFRRGGHGFFVHGFAKNEKSNITATETRALKKLADTLLALSDADIETALKAGELRSLADVEDEDQSQEG